MPLRITLFIAIACLFITESNRVYSNQAEIIVFENGNVITVNNAFEITNAVAISEGRIIALGSKAIDLKKNTGVKVVDLNGKTLMPGLMDSHAHPVGAATYEHDHEIPDIQDINQLLAYIANRAKIQPEGTVINVRQVFITRLKEQRYPTRAELDQVAPRHPIVFSTGPDSMLNSLALKLAGIDRNYQVPKGSAGFIEKDNKGEPTGLLRAFSANVKAPSFSRNPTTEETRKHLKDLFEDYNSVGFTTIADRGAAASSIPVYEYLKNSGQLSVRLRLSHTFPSENVSWDETEKALDKIISHPLRKPDPMLQIIGTKIWLDGGMLTGSALMQEPWGVSKIYGITDPAYRGVQRTPSTYLSRMIRKVADSGLQFTAHSVGDGAVKLLVDTYEAVDREKTIRDSRPCITHCNFMDPETIQKAARLGVMVDLQPIWFYLDGNTLLKQFGKERMSRFQPLRTMIDSGLVVGFGSDHMQKIGSLRSVNPYDPWLAMWIAVSRQCRFMEEPLYLSSGLTRREAIRQYTIENAKILFLEKETGSLEPGKLADFIIVDRDPMTCPESQIRDVKVLETWLGGRKIWVRPTQAQN